MPTRREALKKLPRQTQLLINAVLSIPMWSGEPFRCVYCRGNHGRGSKCWAKTVVARAKSTQKLLGGYVCK